MHLPDSLAPLPVTPPGHDTRGNARVEIEDFVSAVDVRRMLLGTAGELPVEGLSADGFDSFAGRADVPYPGRSPFSAGREVELRVPDLRLEPRIIHPAFEILPPPARRAAAPKVAPTVDCEASYGLERRGQRWWVFGMGLAAAAIFLSGTLVDFISREAVRRSHAAAPLDIFHVILGNPAPNVEEPGGTEFAAKLEPPVVE